MCIRDRIEEGRQIEAQHLLEREHCVENARASELIAGEEEFTFLSPLRHALVESQWEDPALRPLMETLNAGRKALLGPNSRVHLRLAADYGLEGLVAQSNGNHLG